MKIEDSLDVVIPEEDESFAFLAAKLNGITD